MPLMQVYIVIALILVSDVVTWRIHSWYDGYQNSKVEAKIIDDRVIQEKNSNADAAKTEEKIVADQQSATDQNQKLEKEIESKPKNYDCVIDPAGVRLLQQAVTAHTRAR